MNVLYCLNCEKNVSVSSSEKPECSNCWGDEFKDVEDIVLSEKTSNIKGSVKSIDLIYQSNFEKIHLDLSSDKHILGRNFIGSELLSKILNNNNPVISRRHCLIEYKIDQNCFFVKDLNSTNGTFVDEKNCINEVLLEDQSVLKLGREIFAVSFAYTETEIESVSEIDSKEDSSLKSIINYFCSDCSTKYETDGYCSNCDVKLKKE